ncbi:MAG: ABC transporter permease [Phycisphaerae bacterium]|nr:ABC transporter permease [Phycisphaerae bacterium]
MTSAPNASAPSSPRTTAARKFVRALGPLLGLAGVVLFFWIVGHLTGKPDQGLVSFADIRLISLQTAIVAIVAMGMTLVIASGGIDLSVGSGVALASVVCALALKNGQSTSVAVLSAVGTGVFCGLYNAVLITLLRLPPFIATLGTLGVFRGVSIWLASGSVVSAPEATGKPLYAIVSASPTPAWIAFAPAVWGMIGVVALTALIIHRTVFGRRAVAIGSNPVAAAYAGVPMNRVKIGVYAVLGLAVGIAGVLQFARLTVGDPTVRVGLELDVIAAVVIGGASLNGGHASIVGTLVGAVMMAYLQSRCAALGWPNYVQQIIVGHIIIAAVAIDQWRSRRAV